METSPRALAELLAQVGRAAYRVSSDQDRTPAQWMALRYLSRANRFSRTVSAFADYHATTRGTASQTVKRLIEQGYVTRVPSARDGRSVRLDLTKKGRGALLDDPLEALVRSVDSIPGRNRTDMTRRLERVLEHMAASEVARERGGREELERICMNFAPRRPSQPAR